MITKEELNKVNELLDKKYNIQSVIRSFDSPHVQARAGLVAVNAASKNEVGKHDESDFIHRMKNVEQQLTEHLKVLLEAELLIVNAEISKYLKNP